uniref:Late endosomal/lysosomal adaptor and MAPK and MTOR activator 4 n=1 Tax=Elaeophora elaphi TaxID=1147741 RepID=A0A0R3S1Y9_9BILA
MDTSFSFLNHIPGQRGYIVISTGCIIKSDGELENDEFLALNIQKMLSVGEPLVHVIGEIEKMTIAYPEYNLEVARSGKYVFIVKKKTNN